MMLAFAVAFGCALLACGSRVSQLSRSTSCVSELEPHSSASHRSCAVESLLHHHLAIADVNHDHHLERRAAFNFGNKLVRETSQSADDIAAAASSSSFSDKTLLTRVPRTELATKMLARSFRGRRMNRVKVEELRSLLPPGNVFLSGPRRNIAWVRDDGELTTALDRELYLTVHEVKRLKRMISQTDYFDKLTEGTQQEASHPSSRSAREDAAPAASPLSFLLRNAGASAPPQPPAAAFAAPSNVAGVTHMGGVDRVSPPRAHQQPRAEQYHRSSNSAFHPYARPEQLIHQAPSALPTPPNSVTPTNPSQRKTVRLFGVELEKEKP